jgi:calcineurin-like phosphoesterase family protein
MRKLLLLTLAVFAAASIVSQPSAQQGTADDVQVTPIDPPAHPLPEEAETARVRRFSFFAYGDTRSPGPQRGSEEPPLDGRVVQGPHSAVVDAMIATAQQLASSRFPARFVVSSGDAVLYGPNGKMWNVSYVPVIDRLIRQTGLSFFYAPGNHDTTTRPSGDPEREHGVRNVLNAMSKLMPPNASPRRLAGYPTFSFGYGNSFFILLDSDIATDEKQLAWITKQLEGLDRSRYRHIFAVFHHPPFDSGQYGADVLQAQSAAIRTLYLPLFEKHHVRMTITGHDHLLDHFVERYEDGGRRYRMDHLVSGGGGAPTYVYRGEQDLQAYLAANAARKVRIEHLIKPGPAIADNPHHFLVVRVDGDRVSLEVVATGTTSFVPYGKRRIDLN